MSGDVRSGARDRRSSLVASPYGLPSTLDANEAASWAAKWVRDVIAPQTAVHVVMPDASAGSRIIGGGSDRCRWDPT
jgi:hypothetical protein